MGLWCCVVSVSKIRLLKYFNPIISTSDHIVEGRFSDGVGKKTVCLRCPGSLSVYQTEHIRAFHSFVSHKPN